MQRCEADPELCKNISSLMANGFFDKREHDPEAEDKLPDSAHRYSNLPNKFVRDALTSWEPGSDTRMPCCGQ
eukprot:9812435-Karenia_brevis.AAC.1